MSTETTPASCYLFTAMTGPRITSVLPGERIQVSEHAPAAGLEPHVEGYWTLKLETPPATLRVVPDGLVDLTFDLGARPGVFVTGARIGSVEYRHEHPAQLLGASLHPIAATTLLGVSAAKLTGQWQPLEQFIGPVAAELLAHVLEAPTLARQLAVIDAFLLSRLAQAMPDSRVASALAQIVEQDGDVEIPSLGKTAGASPRNLGRLFDAWVGISPKRFARIVRTQVALRRLREVPQSDLSMLAAELGFSDHAHLTRELRALTGHNPSELTARLRTLSDSFKR